MRLPVSSLWIHVEELPAVHPALPAAGWIITTRTGTKRWCPVKLLPIADTLQLVKELRILDLKDQFQRAEDKAEWLNGLEVVMTQNQIEQLRREVELELPRDQAQQDDRYYWLKYNAAKAVIDTLGANPYITGNSHPFRKLCLDDSHFRTVNPNWDRFGAHRTGRKLRSAWKNGIPWQHVAHKPPQWGIWQPLRTLIAHTDLHEGPRHDAVLITRSGLAKLQAQLPFSTNPDRVRPTEHETERLCTLSRNTEFGTLPTPRVVGHYHVHDQTMKLMAACGVQGMCFVLNQEITVDGIPVDVIISPEMVQAKSAWTVLLNNDIPLEKVEHHLVQFELERRTPPPGWRVDERLLRRCGVGLVVTEHWASTNHNEVYFARTDQTLTVRPEQHFCAGLTHPGLDEELLRDLEDYHQLASVLARYH